MPIVSTQTRPSGVKQVDCQSWDDYIQELRKPRWMYTPFYRGHALSSWALASPAERILEHKFGSHLPGSSLTDFATENYIRIRREGACDRFIEYAKNLPGVNLNGLSREEILALARHHGLITDLLDWTGSPFIAAFFAYMGAVRYATERNSIFEAFKKPSLGFVSNLSLGRPCLPQDRAAVWTIVDDPQLFGSDELSWFTTHSAGNYWQKAQRGIFTRLRSDRYLDLERYLQSIEMADRLTCYMLPPQDALIALGDLDRMNINYATLFPDLNGVALHADVGGSIKQAGWILDP